MISVAAMIAAFTFLPGVDAGQGSPVIRTEVVPLFSGFAVGKPYSGPVASPKFKSKVDREYLEPVLGRTALEPNFAGHFRIVQFRIGTGPIGAVLVDSKTGSVFRLPHEVVKDDFFIHSTDCLPSLRGLEWAKAGDEEDASAPLSFKIDSELLVVKQCRLRGATVEAVDRSYYRWCGRKWRFLQRLAWPPPPMAVY